LAAQTSKHTICHVIVTARKLIKYVFPICVIAWAAGDFVNEPLLHQEIQILTTLILIFSNYCQEVLKKVYRSVDTGSRKTPCPTKMYVAYCQGTICARCILAALWTIRLGLTKVEN